MEMNDRTIRNILSKYVEKDYYATRVITAALCLLADAIEDKDSELYKHVIELYGTELLSCIEELTPYY